MAVSMRICDRPVFIEALASPSSQGVWPVQGQAFCLVILADDKIPPSDLDGFSRFAESTIASGARLVIACGTAATQIEELFDEVIAAQAATDHPLLKAEDIVLTVALQQVPLCRVVREVFEVYELPKQYRRTESPVVFLLLARHGRDGLVSGLSEELRRFAAGETH